uniref:TNFR-Cys domain-containing protein n=1 Tax=Biomphalaria glabrata TaxID=6526 RepID=A0A2C9LTF1_BIOGL
MFTITFVLALMLVPCRGIPAIEDVNADTDALICGPGEFKNTTLQHTVCQKCHPETFMNEKGHKQKSCHVCTPYHVSIDHVLELESCTPERDTVLKKCERGFYVFEHDRLTYKYECRPCKLNDCQVSGDCCELSHPTSNITTASTSPNLSTSGKEPTTPPQLFSSPQTSNSTRCENIPIDSRACFPEAFMNKTCLESTSLVVLCQNCKRILQINITGCSPQKATESEGTTISSGEIAAIISLLAVVFIIVCCVCFRKKVSNICSRIYNKLKYKSPKEAPTETAVRLLTISYINEPRLQNEQ